MAAQKVPIGRTIFIQEKNFKSALDILKDNTVLVIAGPSGCGKTELALQLQKKYQNKDRKNFFGDVLLCDSKEALAKSLKDFVRRNELNVSQDVLAKEDLSDAFDEVFEQMNICFRNKMKFLIFDDAERDSRVLFHIDQAILSVFEQEAADDDSMRKNWKIVLTTQDKGKNNWRADCDYLPADVFLAVNGVDDGEIYPLLHQSERGKEFNDEDVTLMKKTFGNIPLMLNVAKKLADKETWLTPGQSLRKLVDDIGRKGKEDPNVSGLFISIQRVVKQTKEHGREYQDLIRMLTMYHETNIPAELLISCSEVVISSKGKDSIDEVAKQAKNLHREFIHDMTNRSLFDEPVPFGGTTLLSFHKLFKQGMRQYSAEENNRDNDLRVARQALLALTRVMPRDGRSHSSHLFEFMYQHAESLLREVEALKHHGLVDRTKTPLLMLLTCILRLSMGYCRYSMKYPASDALKHVEEALTIYSKLFVDQDYDQLGAWHPDQPRDVQKAETLFEDRFETELNTEIVEWLEKLSFYVPLTERDRNILFPEGVPTGFLNDHLDEAQMRQVRFYDKALKPDKLSKVYALEFLADAYSMAAKILSSDADRHQDATGYYKAAIFLYRKVKERCGVTLLGEIVLEREMLNMRLKTSDLSVASLDEMIEQWKILRDTDDRAFECGLMRANFNDDPYNRFLCIEGITRCKGRQCALDNTEAAFNEVNKLFKEQLEEAEQQAKNQKLQMNKQTISKAYRYYGEFLLRCGHGREAVKAAIDSLYHLHHFFEGRLKGRSFREQEMNCGKAKPLWELLKKAYENYDAGESRGVLLESDDCRVNFVKKSVAHWRENRLKKDDRFDVLEHILHASNVPEGEPAVDGLRTPQQATDAPL